ncbi:MAG TPA: TIM barrel protein, partial [Oceanipulchritudo sp.]|nr:TIM barrel protein [Oceanipulchritudo sp.]
MNTISFMSANFVARELGYNMPDGWGRGDTATSEFFAPLNTYEERLDAMLAEVAALGFKAIDIWISHLNHLWATPTHLDIAKRLLDKHKLRPVSYAGWFANTPAELEAACQVCLHLGIPVLGGGLPLVQTDRVAAVAILRKHGLIFAFENHPEKSAAEVLAKLGDGDEDVLGVAIDTGWFATQGADALTELKALFPRVKHVHLKDVLPKPAEKTGYPFKDMGHQTCELGEGIVPVRECIEYLVTHGYRGAIGIEHEPEDFDPSEDAKHSLVSVQQWFKDAIAKIAPADPVGVAIVGCGNIADRYAAQINSYPHVKLLGAQDIDTARAEKLTGTYGGKVYETLEEVLA